MPKSKRQRVKPLTQTGKKTRELKTQVIEAVRSAVDQYDAVYTYSFQNMRTNHFKVVRMDFRDSRFFMGKSKVMKVALGKSKEDEYSDDLSLLAKDVSGQTGLLFTNKSHEEVKKYFDNLSEIDYARSGFKATETVTVPAGPLPEFVGSMVEELRKLGLPVELQDGKINLRAEHVVCKKGAALTPEQCKLLIHFAKPMAEFRIQLVSRWSNGKYERYVERDDENDDDSDDMDE